jgi:hypothetical protein
MTEHLPAVIDRAKITADRAHVVPALIAASGTQASIRFLEFFAARIRNPNTRRAYGRAVAEFMAWCEEHGALTLHGLAVAVCPGGADTAAPPEMPSRRRP